MRPEKETKTPQSLETRNKEITEACTKDGDRMSWKSAFCFWFSGLISRDGPLAQEGASVCGGCQTSQVPGEGCRQKVLQHPWLLYQPRSFCLCPCCLPSAASLQDVLIPLVPHGSAELLKGCWAWDFKYSGSADLAAMVKIRIDKAKS